MSVTSLPCNEPQCFVLRSQMAIAVPQCINDKGGICYLILKPEIIGSLLSCPICF